MKLQSGFTLYQKYKNLQLLLRNYLTWKKNHVMQIKNIQRMNIFSQKIASIFPLDNIHLNPYILTLIQGLNIYYDTFLSFLTVIVPGWKKYHKQ